VSQQWELAAAAAMTKPQPVLRNRQSNLQLARNTDNQTLAVIASGGHGQRALCPFASHAPHARETTRTLPREGISAPSRGGRQRHSP